MRCRRRVDVGVGGKIVVAVPQPGLNVLQRVAQVQHDRGAAVPQIMEADAAELVFLQDLLKFLGNIVRLEQGPQIVHADEIRVTGIIAGPA